jgi:molybdopterin synthase sulfur carrier subunit
MREVRILYFAWLRERAGRGEEDVALPPDIRTVGGLMDWLGQRNPALAEAFGMRRVVRAAVNQSFASAETPVEAGDEVAFFPPVTGG